MDSNLLVRKLPIILHSLLLKIISLQSHCPIGRRCSTRPTETLVHVPTAYTGSWVLTYWELFLFLFMPTLDIGPDSSLMMHAPHQTREQNQKACSQWTQQVIAMLTFIFACVHSVSSFNGFLIVEPRLLISSASGFWGCCRVDMRYVMVVVLFSSIFWPAVQRGHDCSLWSDDGIRHGVGRGCLQSGDGIRHGVGGGQLTVGWQHQAWCWWGTRNRATGHLSRCCGKRWSSQHSLEAAGVKLHARYTTVGAALLVAAG